MPVLESVLPAAGDESQDDIILTVSTTDVVSDIFSASESNVTLYGAWQWPTPSGRGTTSVSKWRALSGNCRSSVTMSNSGMSPRY